MTIGLCALHQGTLKCHQKTKLKTPHPQQKKQQKPLRPKPSKPKSSVIQIHPEGERIHPKKAEGRFAKLRIAAVLATQFVFYVIPWFNWSGRQAVLFNIPDRHFFIFGLSLGMGDLIYLALLLMICAFGLFWWTTIAGRLLVRLFMPAKRFTPKLCCGLTTWSKAIETNA